MSMASECTGKCGVTAYRNGCRLPACKSVNAQRMANYRASNNKTTKPPTDNVVPITGKAKAPTTEPQTHQKSNTLGYNEREVIRQCELSPLADERPGDVAQARALARILDNAEIMNVWPRASAELQKILGGLNPQRKRKSGGRLATVQAMGGGAQRKAAQ